MSQRRRATAGGIWPDEQKSSEEDIKVEPVEESNNKVVVKIMPEDSPDTCKVKRARKLDKTISKVLSNTNAQSLDKKKLKQWQVSHAIATGHHHNDEHSCSDVSQFEEDILDIANKYEDEGSGRRYLCFLKRKKGQ